MKLPLEKAECSAPLFGFSAHAHNRLTVAEKSHAMLYVVSTSAQLYDFKTLAIGA